MKLSTKTLMELSNRFKAMGEEMIAVSSIISQAINEGAETETVSKDVATPKAEKTVKETKKVEEPVEETEEEDSADREAELKEMSYNDIKALAKSFGLKAVGSKDKLIEAILEAEQTNISENDDVTEGDVDSDVEVDQNEEDEDDDVEDDEEEVNEEDEEPTTYDKVVSSLGESTDEELAEILSDVGISPKGKRQALIAKIVEAVDKGLLELDDEEEVDEDDQDQDVEATEENDEDDWYTQEELEEMEEDDLLEIAEDNEIDPPYVKKGKKKVLDKATLIEQILALADEEEEEADDSEDDEEVEGFKGSEERVEAIEALVEELQDQQEKGTLKHKEVLKFLKSYYNDKYKSTSKEADYEEYIRIQCELIDDEGEAHDLEEAYYVGEEVYCCGAELKEVDDNYVCEHCGSEYDSE